MGEIKFATDGDTATISVTVPTAVSKQAACSEVARGRDDKFLNALSAKIMVEQAIALLQREVAKHALVIVPPAPVVDEAPDITVDFATEAKVTVAAQVAEAAKLADAQPAKSQRL